MALTKAHIIEGVSANSGLLKIQSTKKKTLSSGEGVLISGFGKFYCSSSLRSKMNGKV